MVVHRRLGAAAAAAAALLGLARRRGRGVGLCAPRAERGRAGHLLCRRHGAGRRPLLHVLQPGGARLPCGLPGGAGGQLHPARVERGQRHRHARGHPRQLAHRRHLGRRRGAERLCAGRLHQRAALARMGDRPFGDQPLRPGDEVRHRLHRALPRPHLHLAHHQRGADHFLPAGALVLDRRVLAGPARLCAASRSAVDFGAAGALAGLGPFGILPGTRDGRATVRGDDIAVGWTLGAVWEPQDGTRVGLSFRSALFHKLEGDGYFQGAPGPLANSVNFRNTDVQGEADDAGNALPRRRAKVGARWTLLGDLSWTNWSRFRELRVDYASGRRPTCRNRTGATPGRSRSAPSTRPRSAPAAGRRRLRPVAARDAYRTPRIPDSDR